MRSETAGLLDFVRNLEIDRLSRVAICRLEGHDRAAIRRLTRRIQASLKVDRKRRVTIAGEKVEALLAQETPDLQGAWNALKGWYREAGDRAPPPSRDTKPRLCVHQTGGRLPPHGFVFGKNKDLIPNGTPDGSETP